MHANENKRVKICKEREHGGADRALDKDSGVSCSRLRSQFCLQPAVCVFRPSLSGPPSLKRRG